MTGPAMVWVMAAVLKRLFFDRRGLDHAAVRRRQRMRVVVIALRLGCVHVVGLAPLLLLLVLVHDELGLGGRVRVRVSFGAGVARVVGARRFAVVHVFLIVVGGAVGDGVAPGETRLVASDQTDMLADFAKLQRCVVVKWSVFRYWFA